MTPRSLRSSSVVPALGLVWLALLACKQGPSACPGRYADLSEAQKNTNFECKCSGAAQGSVWGSGIYTQDSALCAAAQHAGAVPASGGQIAVQKAPGCPAYGGTTANGVTTGAWGVYAGSFYFTGHGDGKCEAPKQGECPSHFKEVPGYATVGEYSCSCSGAGTGAVWGTGVYTTDSSVCRAAVHAGVIPATGGKVTVKPAAGCSGYVGSTANEVTTGGWASYDSSFYFPSKGDGKCVEPKPGTCPGSFKSFPNLSGADEFSCDCGAAGTGSVWGSGIYTTDSSVCRAAVHAGAIPASGGKITAHKAKGCGSYAANTQNGISSSSWGAYDASFYFVGHGDGKCK